MTFRSLLVLARSRVIKSYSPECFSEVKLVRKGIINRATFTVDLLCLVELHAGGASDPRSPKSTYISKCH